MLLVPRALFPGGVTAPRLTASPHPCTCRFRILSVSAATSTSISPAHFAVDDYLVVACHLTPAQAAKAAKYLSHLKSPSKPDAVLAFLAGLGLSPAETAAVVAAYPRLLCTRVDRSLAPTVAELRGLGLSPSHIARLAQRAGSSFLGPSFVAKLHFLLPLFGSADRLLQAAERNYFLLAVDLEKVVRPNIAIFEQCGLRARDIAKLVVASPRLLSMHPEYVQAVVERSVELGVPRSSLMFRHALAIAASNSRETLDAKLRALRETPGWSHAEARLAVSKGPRILGLSEERLQRSAAFLTTELGLEPGYIARRPALLMYSLEQRLAPRHYVVKLLKARGLLEEGRCFYNAVALSEDKFLEKFVLPHEKAVPGLAAAYVAACDGEVPAGVELGVASHSEEII